MPEDVVEHVRFGREFQLVPVSHEIGHQESLPGEGLVPGHGVRVADMGPHGSPSGPGGYAAVQVLKRGDPLARQIQNLEPVQVFTAGTIPDLRELTGEEGAPDPVMLVGKLHGRASTAI